MPHGKEGEVKKLFPKHNVTERVQSNQGKYISITVEMMLPSSQAVIDVYVQASAIEGIVAL